ncbi:MAG TPA: hypothetical protein VFT95_21445, partial [Micromonosporaceae bacterium]|nr:hypothetical protein [Micromonosporaceae bacterium]
GDVALRLPRPGADVDRRQAHRRRERLPVRALAAAVLGGAAVVRSGAVTPRLAVDAGWSASYEYPDATSRAMVSFGHPVSTHVSQAFELANEGWTDLEILGMDTDRAGMRLERVALGRTYFDQERDMWRVGGDTLTAERPYLLKGGASVHVTIYYHVTDCRAVPASPQPVPVRVRRLFGERTVDVVLPTVRMDTTGGYGVSVPGDPEAIPWQRFIAAHVCRTR